MHKMISTNNVKIAVMGKMRSGKTTASNYLANKMDGTVYDFSDALKDVTNIMYPHTKNIKDRALLQTVGQHMRIIDKDVWVNALLNKVKEDKPKVAIITGLRQPNEYDALKKDGCYMIKIVSTENTRVNRALKSGDKMTRDNLNHETEMYIDGFDADVTVINDGNLNELYKKLDYALAYISNKETQRSFFNDPKGFLGR